MAISKIKVNGTTHDIKDNSKLPLAGGTLTGNLTIKNSATLQSGQPSIIWGTFGANSNRPYVGFAQDQTDGTFILGNLKSANYADGLAIGGGSGNLLWKGSKVATVSDIPSAYAHPTYTARTGKPTANQTPAFGGTATVSQITSDGTGHVTAATDRTIKIPDTLSNGTGTAGLIKTSSTVTSNSGYTACPVISGVPYYKDTNTAVTQTVRTTNGEFPILLRGTSAGTTTTTTTTTFGTKMTANPSTGKLTMGGGFEATGHCYINGDKNLYINGYLGLSRVDNAETGVTLVGDTDGLLLFDTVSGDAVTISGVDYPTENEQAANKVYVDGLYVTNGATSGTITLADNTYYELIATGAFTLKGSSAVNAWGFIQPAGAITCTGFFAIGGDNPANATSGEFWEFNTMGGFIVFKNWTNGYLSGGYVG